jgi:uncharacterized membrane protein YeaQ/YmgE (transglycosylase-associated protein family)
VIGDIIAYAFFGLVVGALARLFLPGRRHMGCLATIIAGLIGSFVAGFAVRLLSGNSNYKPGWIASVLGAMLVVWLYTRSQSERDYY